MQTGFARSWALEWTPSDIGLQIRQIGEHVRLSAKFVGDQWRLAGNRGDHRDANTASLHGFDHERKSSFRSSGRLSSKAATVLRMR
jgi:hypothetical protein